MKLVISAVLALSIAVLGAPSFAQSAVVIASAQTATGASAKVTGNNNNRTYQASGTTTAGAGAATVKIQGSNVVQPAVDGDWVDIGTITLTLATTKSGDGFTSDAPWLNVRSNVTAISGTGAAVTVMMGVGR